VKYRVIIQPPAAAEMDGRQKKLATAMGLNLVTF
jgi:hypothetical protein